MSVVNKCVFSQKLSLSLLGKVLLYLGPPKQKLTRPYSWKVKARTGEPAYIIVNNWGCPEPNYTWCRLHDTIIVPIRTHYDGGTFSIVNITSVDLFSFGLYWVKMENSYGMDTVEIQLVPYGNVRFHQPSTKKK